jgi:hypothetical protein
LFRSAGTGVENDELTMLSARIMVVAIAPFIIAQLSAIFHFSTERNYPILAACVMAFALLLSYCLYQVFPLSYYRGLSYAHIQIMHPKHQDTAHSKLW